jgi:hypothetical protein
MISQLSTPVRADCAVGMIRSADSEQDLIIFGFGWRIAAAHWKSLFT